jgi:hypothetical protein
MVLANNNELVLLPINEPTYGTKRKSQIQVRQGGLSSCSLHAEYLAQVLRVCAVDMLQYAALH